MEEESKGGSGMIIMIIVVGLLFLAGVGALAYYLINRSRNVQTVVAPPNNPPYVDLEFLQYLADMQNKNGQTGTAATGTTTGTTVPTVPTAPTVPTVPTVPATPAAPAAPAPPTYPYIMPANMWIPPNKKIYSQNNKYYIMLTADGKVCTTDTTDGSSKWCSPTANPPLAAGETAPGNYLAMQSDGNFCVYKGLSPSASKGALWCSQKLSDVRPNYAHVQNDGRVCTYKGTNPDDNRGLLWCTS